MRSRPLPLVLKATCLALAPQPPLCLRTLDTLLSATMHNPQAAIDDRVEAAAQLLLACEPVAGHA